MRLQACATIPGRTFIPYSIIFILLSLKELLELRLADGIIKLDNKVQGDGSVVRILAVKSNNFEFSPRIHVAGQSQSYM